MTKDELVSIAAWNQRATGKRVDPRVAFNDAMEKFPKTMAYLAKGGGDDRPQPEPVAWRYDHPDPKYAADTGYGTWRLTEADKASGWTETPLYTHPTDAKIKALVEAAKGMLEYSQMNERWQDAHPEYVRAIESALAAFEGDV